MKPTLILPAAFGAALLVATGGVARGAGSPAGAAVFVQTNEPTGNHIVVYDRGSDGVLSEAGRYSTGGDGGVAAPGTESDHLASQGSLVYDGRHSLLFAVNAGSDSLSVFGVSGDRLTLRQVVSSGGAFPVSIAISRNLLYVLDGGGTGSLQGFRITGSHLTPIAGSTRTLGLANSDPPNFLMSPGQAGFTPDGRQLVVTTKASGSFVDVFGVRPNGRLSAAPTANGAATPGPFAFRCQPGTQRLVDGEAGASSVTTNALTGDGALADPKSQSDNQIALCWITRVGSFYYVSNTGSNTVSGYQIDPSGQPSLLAAGTGVVATTVAGPVDSAAAAGRFLYVQTGIGGTVDEYRVNVDGTLAQIGTVTGLPPGQEGIAAT
jgi:hypothetical protein